MKQLYGVCAVIATGFLGCFVEANSPPAQISQNMTPPPPIFIGSPQGAATACPCPAVALCEGWMISPSTKKNALIASRQKRAGSMPDIHESKAAREAVNVKTAPSTATAASQGSPHAISKPIPIPLARSKSVTPRGMQYGATLFTNTKLTSPLSKPLNGHQSPAAAAYEVAQFKIMVGSLEQPFKALKGALTGMHYMQGSWSKPAHTIDHSELAGLIGRIDTILAKYRPQ